MIFGDKTICPICGYDLKYYDSVNRKVKSKKGKIKIIRLKRFQCFFCSGIHRQIPNNIIPYKQYDSEIIFGVLDGFITSYTYGYEDYPCEATMNRWASQKIHLPL